MWVAVACGDMPRPLGQPPPPWRVRDWKWVRIKSRAAIKWNEISFSKVACPQKCAEQFKPSTRNTPPSTHTHMQGEKEEREREEINWNQWQKIQRYLPMCAWEGVSVRGCARVWVQPNEDTQKKKQRIRMNKEHGKSTGLHWQKRDWFKVKKKYLQTQSW